MRKGRIAKYFDEKGFGFIAPDDGGKDVWFHVRNVNDRGYEVGPGVPVEFEEGLGRSGKPEAKRAVVLGEADDRTSTPAPRDQERPAKNDSANLPPECIFSTFYDESNNPLARICFNSPEVAAEMFRGAGLTATQFRQLYQGFLSFAAPLRDNRMNFLAASERFGVFYCERVVRQFKRGKLPRVVKDLIDAHRDLALRERREMLELFRYLTNIYCYFGDSEK